MPRKIHVHAGLLVFIALAACDLTRVPPPPVPLTVLEGVQAAAGDEPWMATGNQPRARLLRAAPPAALATIHLPDIGGAIQRFQKTGLYAWISSPEFQRDLGPLAEFFKANLSATTPAGSPVDAQRILNALKGEFVLCLEDIVVQDGQEPEPRLFAGITVAGAESDVEQLLHMLDMMAAAQKGVQVEKGAVEGQAFSRIVGREPRPYVVEVALYQDALLVGFGRETVTAALGRLQDDTARSLADGEGFREAWSRCGGAKDALRVHVDVGAAIARFGGMIPPDAMDVLRELGLTQVRSLAAAIAFDGVDITVATLLDSPGGNDIVTQLLAPHPVDRSFLGRIPPEASAFSLFALDGRRVLDTLRRVLPDEPKADLEKWLGALRRDGLDVETDILEVFGPRCALVNIDSRRPVGHGIDAVWGQLMQAALICEVKDPVRARTVLRKMPAGGDGVHRREFTVDGRAAVSYRIDAAELPADFALSYALDGNYLCVAASEDSLRRLLRAVDPATTKRYRTHLNEAPETAVVLTYDEMRQGNTLLLNTLIHSASQGMGGDPIAGPSVPVAGASVLASMGPTVSWTVADNRGVYSFTRSPTAGIGSSGGLTGLLALGAVALPNLHMSRIRANEQRALATLRMIQVSQQTSRANALRDADGDGEGEYVFLVELMGGSRAESERPPSGRGLLQASLKKQGADYTLGGYRFRVYLPAEDGSPVGEHEPAARRMQVDGDLAETVMVAVAWPVDHGLSGTKTFFLDTTGVVHVCEGGRYSDEAAPAPDLFSSQPNNLASAPLRPGQPTRDGETWSRIR